MDGNSTIQARYVIILKQKAIDLAQWRMQNK